MGTTGAHLPANLLPKFQAVPLRLQQRPPPLKLHLLKHRPLSHQLLKLSQLPRPPSTHLSVLLTFLLIGSIKLLAFCTRVRVSDSACSTSLTRRRRALLFVRQTTLVLAFWQRRTAVSSSLTPWSTALSRSMCSTRKTTTTNLAKFSSATTEVRRTLPSHGLPSKWTAATPEMPRRTRSTSCSADSIKLSSATRTLTTASVALLLV